MLLYPRTSILQLTAAMYRHMGLLPTHLARLITTSPHQYVAGTHTLATFDPDGTCF